jgi:hypothetical protein
VGTADREIFVFGEAEPLTPFGALARSDGDASSARSLSSRNARLSGPADGHDHTQYVFTQPDQIRAPQPDLEDLPARRVTLLTQLRRQRGWSCLLMGQGRRS